MESRASLLSAASLPTTAVGELVAAIDQVNSRVLIQTLDAVKAPNTQQIASDLKTAAQQGAQNKQTSIGALAALPPGTKRSLIGTARAGDPTVLLMQIQQLLSFAADFDTNKKTCTGMVG